MKIRTVSDAELKDIGKPIILDFIEDSSCDEIITDDICHIITYDKFEYYVKKLITKLHKGGKLKVSGRDIIELAKCVMRQDFNIIEANRLVYGEPDNLILCQLTLNDVTSLLQSLGLKIKKKRLTGYNFFVEATRE